MILVCTCKNEYQDRRYGQNKRVHNECKPLSLGEKRYRCSVCGAVKRKTK